MTPDEIIQRHPIVPVFYHDDFFLTQELILAAYMGGVRAFEFTNRGTSAIRVFGQLVPFVQEYCPGLTLGIGTIYDTNTAKTFIDLGAAFVVQPITSPTVGAYCQEVSVAWYPGAMTPTEVYHATQLGANLVKIFPGNVVGSGFVQAIKGPMPNLKVMVTGGVEPTNESLSTWFTAGVSAVGIGAKLFPETLVSQRKFQELSQNIASLFSFISPFLP